MAEAVEWQPLREALQGWSALERAEQRRRMARVVERIDYDGRRGGTASVLAVHAPAALISSYR